MKRFYMNSRFICAAWLEFLCAVHCLTKWKWLGQVLYTICLPGTVLALLFPNWNFYPVIHFITLEGFLFHMGIVLYVAGKNLHPMKFDRIFAKLWQVVLFLTAVVIPIYWFDKRYDVNYMFCELAIRRISACLAGRQAGKPGYLTGYAALVFLCMLLMDAGYLIVAGRKN